MIANHPSNTFIWDKDVSDLDMSLIDKQWYIDMTYKRLNDYMGGK